MGGITLSNIDKEILEELEQCSSVDASKFPQPITRDVGDVTIDPADKRNIVKGQLDNDGTVAVINQVVKVSDPTDNGKYPTIIPGNNVTVTVNGAKISNKTVVSAADNVAVKPDIVDPKMNYKINISDDLMTVHLSVSYIRGKNYKVINSKDVKDLVIAAYLVEEPLPPKLKFETVSLKLAEKNVVHFDQIKVMILLESGENVDNELIAQGVEPKSPVDETIEYIFKKERPQTSSRPQSEIISVKPGEVLAVKKPGIPGEAGFDLSGAVIDPAKPKKVDIKVRKGVKLTEDGTKAIAIIGGRPEVSRGYISVFPVYSHMGDVTPTSGDIDFNGDLKINGSIHDYMLVRASGNVTVKGDVANARIYAGGDVIVNGKIIGSKISAGGSSVLCKEIIHYLGDVYAYLHSLLKYLDQLGKAVTTGNLPVGRAVKVLLEKKLRDLPKLCVKFADKIEDREEYNTIDKSVVNLIDELAVSFFGYGPMRKFTAVEDVEKLTQKVAEAVRLLEGLINKVSNIYGNYVQSSELRASGDININGEGCFQCTLNAGKHVNVYGAKGLFKGGQIRANGNIRVTEAGSQLGAGTGLKTTVNYNIRVGTAWPGVELNVGGMRKVCIDKEENVYLHVKEVKG